MTDNSPKKTDAQAIAEEHSATVSGFQEGVAYPSIPQTPQDFQQLLENPDKPAENQSAPPPEKLNPHLFGPQGRL
jgi:hypothetical protein